MQDLFYEPQLSFEKIAAETALSEDPNSWPNEILQELFKQVPFISDFAPHIVMDKVDGERGYGFGHVQITNSTGMSPDATTEAVEAAGIREVRIPVIIRDNNLLPFDVIITEGGKVVPLTEMRLRQAIFRPQSFDMTSAGPGDQSMVSQLYPPFRQNYGGASGAMLGKEGSVLSHVLPSAHPGDLDRFYASVSEKEVQAAFLVNSAALDPLRKIAAAELIPLQKRAAALPSIIKPSVVQVVKEAEGYTVKTASHLFWEPVVQVVNRGEVVRRFGEKVALAADVDGAITAADGADTAEESEQGSAELIKDFGIYRVADAQGRELVGYVFPNLIDVDGTQLPMALFTNGSQSALQGEIVGTRVGDAVPIHEGAPKGKGCFYFMGEGEAHATVPIEVHAALTDEAGASLMATTIDGRQVEVQIQPNLEQVQLVDETLLIPDHYKWISLEGAEEVDLVGTAMEPGKEVQAHVLEKTVTIRGDHSFRFSLEGAPVAKLASVQASFVSFDDALFLLAGLGVDLNFGIQKLAEAARGQYPVDVQAGRQLKTASEQIEQSKVAAAAWIAGMPDLKRSLVKEAAVIPDPVAVDTVLSLGFVTPENTTSFISAMPQIEEAQQRMCELLIAARLGMRDIPISALEKAVRSTEEVLEGLKVIAFQKN